ncbi:MAG TPA: hypothetical protein VGG48_15885 [Rhizomicrobium sp.]|jgi:hypothetical protein
MANGRSGKRARRAERQLEALRAAVSEPALAMEEPLRHAEHFLRAILMAEQPHNEEVDALAFVAGEAMLLVEDSREALAQIFAALKAA